MVMHGNHRRQRQEMFAGNYFIRYQLWCWDMFGNTVYPMKYALLCCVLCLSHQICTVVLCFVFIPSYIHCCAVLCVYLIKYALLCCALCLSHQICAVVLCFVFIPSNMHCCVVLCVYPIKYALLCCALCLSHQICTVVLCFVFIPSNMHCCGVLCVVMLMLSVISGFMRCIYPYSSGLLHWYWGNHMIAPVPVK